MLKVINFLNKFQVFKPSQLGLFVGCKRAYANTERIRSSSKGFDEIAETRIETYHFRRMLEEGRLDELHMHGRRTLEQYPLEGSIFETSKAEPAEEPKVEPVKPFGLSTEQRWAGSATTEEPKSE